MDGRTSLLLTGGFLLATFGCTQSPVRPPAAAPYAQPDAKPVASTMQAKPSTCVAMADLKAELAASPDRSDADKAQFAAQARDLYQRALTQDPAYMPAWMGLAKIHEITGDLPAAMDTYQKALAKHPKQAALWYHRGMCLARAKEFDNAIHSLQQAANLEPRNAAYTKSLGFCLARAGRPNDALPWLTKSMSEPEARYNLARMLHHIGQTDASLQQLQWVLRAAPDHEAAVAMLNDLNPTPPGAIRPVSHDAPAPAPAPAPGQYIGTVTTVSPHPDDDLPLMPVPVTKRK